MSKTIVQFQKSPTKIRPTFLVRLQKTNSSTGISTPPLETRVRLTDQTDFAGGRKQVKPFSSEISTPCLRAIPFKTGLSYSSGIHLAHKNQLSAPFSFVTVTICASSNEKKAALSSFSNERASSLFIISVSPADSTNSYSVRNCT